MNEFQKLLTIANKVRSSKKIDSDEISSLSKLDRLRFDFLGANMNLHDAARTLLALHRASEALNENGVQESLKSLATWLPAQPK